ncbi:hypothetical protein ACF0H5_019138 [Mactra antiquata]
MGLLIYIRALLVRMLFACHGIIAIWRLYMVTGSVWSWYLGGALFGLFIETLITIAKKRGKEWKWFCPSVFFYLCSVVPAIWFLELHEIEERIQRRAATSTNETNQLNCTAENIIKNRTEESAGETLNLDLDDLGLNIHIPLAISADLWLRVLEQFLLLMLIVGRWILPKGSISHDQLSQLLLVYVGTAADIVEFYEAFSEEEVKYNRLLCYIILGIWTLSLMQFTLVLTATKARRDQVGLPMSPLQDTDEVVGCCNPELYGILTSIMLQDLPFLCVRLTLIFYYHVVSYTNMFFTSKNSLVIVLLIYRIIVVHSEAKKKRRKRRESIALGLQDFHINGNRHAPKGGRNNNKNKSSPNVYVSADASLPRHAKKKEAAGQKKQCVDSVPTKVDSFSNLEIRRKSNTPSEHICVPGEKMS